MLAQIGEWEKADGNMLAQAVPLGDELIAFAETAAESDHILAPGVAIGEGAGQPLENELAELDGVRFDENGDMHVDYSVYAQLASSGVWIDENGDMHVDYAGQAY